MCKSPPEGVGNGFIQRKIKCFYVIFAIEIWQLSFKSCWALKVSYTVLYERYMEHQGQHQRNTSRNPGMI